MNVNRDHASPLWDSTLDLQDTSDHYDIDTPVKSVQHAVHSPFTTGELAGPATDRAKIFDEAGVADDFDKMAAVVDWLDSCRGRNLEALLDSCANGASLECACEGGRVSGRSGLADYWRPKLAGAPPDAFGLEEIAPRGEGVALDYLSFDGERVRIVFAFNAKGKISHMSCRPAPR